MTIATPFVIVSGPPGSGKSTLARKLAPLLGLPLLSKDDIKESTMRRVHVADVEDSRRIGQRAIATMYQLARESTAGAVLESTFHRRLSTPDILSLPSSPASIVEVFCVCSRDLCRSRYRERAPGRSAGHFDDVRSDDEIWNPDVAEPVNGGWPVLRISTEQPADVTHLARAVRRAFDDSVGPLA